VSVITIGDGDEVDVTVDLGTDDVTVEPSPGGGDPEPDPTVYGLMHTQATPAATWTIPHLLGRLPVVATYLTSGEEVDTDLDATTDQVVITWPAPTAGWAVLV
jgi:hypothetical protein